MLDEKIFLIGGGLIISLALLHTIEILAVTFSKMRMKYLRLSIWLFYKGVLTMKSHRES